jgi:hypothetical protein
MRRATVLTVLAVLGLVSVVITAYGTVWMFTSNGLEPPNAIVWLGLAGIALTVIAAARLSRWQR